LGRRLGGTKEGTGGGPLETKRAVCIGSRREKKVSQERNWEKNWSGETIICFWSESRIPIAQWPE